MAADTIVGNNTKSAARGNRNIARQADTIK